MKKEVILVAVFLLGLALGASTIYAYQHLEQKTECALGVTPVFSPANSADIVLNELANAKSSIDVMLYQFSYTPLKDALALAVKRGVHVRIILESRIDSNFATAQDLAADGIEVRWATKDYANTHSKTAVIDRKRTLVGSINWSRHAYELNRESAVIVDSEEVAAEFERIFEEDWNKAQAYRN